MELKTAVQNILTITCHKETQLPRMNIQDMTLISQSVAFLQERLVTEQKEKTKTKKATKKTTPSK